MGGFHVADSIREEGHRGPRITAITWQKEIAPRTAAEFVFRARNPEMGDVISRAHRHFKDGTTADWVGPAGDRRPAAVTKLTAAAGSPQAAVSESSGIEAWLEGTMRRSTRRIWTNSRPSIIRRSLFAKAAASTTVGSRYRDRHLGPELTSFENLQFAHATYR
jgi:hypothetical protein